ncbi:hypothetical protein BMT54_07025 [Pasteurellaceae bacterium 15-036681]|nr:hypothetical protein BMT54_07025 [Pasteurellaceae bacterium 15-036681]
MNFKRLFAIGFASTLLAACGSNSNNFTQTDLKAELYNGYWAMEPVDDIHRVIKFQPNGAVTIYDYTCNSRNGYDYTLNETETVYLSKIKDNQFTIADNKKKSFARLDIVNANRQVLQARQRFIDTGTTLNLYYRNMVGARPIC